MEIDSLMISVDRNRLFADWGVAVVLRQVVQTYSPKDGAIEESTTDYGVTAVVMSGEMQPARGTAGQHAHVDAVFLIRGEDVPAGVQLRSSRVLFNGIEHQVMSTETDGAEATVALNCRAV